MATIPKTFKIFTMYNSNHCYTRDDGVSVEITNAHLVEFKSGDATLHFTMQYDEGITLRYTIVRTSELKVELYYHRDDTGELVRYWHQHRTTSVTNAAELSEHFHWFKELSESVFPRLANW